jgi:hypothetical protein
MHTTEYQGERILYRQLWRIVERQFKDAPLGGSTLDMMVAMVFAFHTFEAYLNFVGERLAPDVWERERDFFRKSPYLGFDGKVRKVFELLEKPEPDRSCRPYSTVWWLKKLRDGIAHAKVDRFCDVVEHEENHLPLPPPGLFDIYATAENGRRARDDIAEVMECIHAHAKPRINDSWFGREALTGPLGYSTGSTVIKK